MSILMEIGSEKKLNPGLGCAGNIKKISINCPLINKTQKDLLISLFNKKQLKMIKKLTNQLSKNFRDC